MKRGLSFELNIIEEIQKQSKSLQLNIGRITRRKDFSNEKDLSYEKIYSVSKEMVNILSESVKKLNEFKSNVENYFINLEPVIKQLQENSITSKTNIINHSENEKTTYSEEKRSSDKEHRENTKRTTEDFSNDEVVPCDNSDEDSTAIITNDNTDKRDESNNLGNKDIDNCAHSPCAEDIRDNDSSEDKTDIKEENLPRLILRIRKIDEVNDLLSQSSYQIANDNSSEIIKLDDNDDVIEINSDDKAKDCEVQKSDKPVSKGKELAKDESFSSSNDDASVTDHNTSKNDKTKTIMESPAELDGDDPQRGSTKRKSSERRFSKDKNTNKLKTGKDDLKPTKNRDEPSQANSSKDEPNKARTSKDDPELTSNDSSNDFSMVMDAVIISSTSGSDSSVSIDTVIFK